MRISIQKHHKAYIEQIAAEMECTTNEALNHLIWILKQQNYHFGNLPLTPTSQHFDPSTFENRATAMSGLSFIPQSPQAIQEFQELQEEIDPVIARLACLVDQF
ncbi:hypothetical protein H6G64_35365 [Calothrix sp. FACHB-156]|nr:hypothetical protein [Calothrix sp. FACHB-156]